MRPAALLHLALGLTLGMAVIQPLSRAWAEAPITQVEPPSAGPLTVREVAERIRPAVVQIVSQSATRGLDLLTGLTFQSAGLGSGVIIDSAGYILTNQHVVAGARTLTVA